jgi:hypothetical protein
VRASIARRTSAPNPLSATLAPRSISRWSSQVAPGALTCAVRSRSDRVARIRVGFGSPGLPIARSSTMPPIAGLCSSASMPGAGHDACGRRAVDHGIGRAGQLVVQPLVDQPADDRLVGRAAEDRVAVERPVLPAILERRADRADDVAARAQLAQLRLRALGDGPLAGLALGGEAHRFQMLQAADHQAAEARIVRAARRAGR